MNTESNRFIFQLGVIVEEGGKEVPCSLENKPGANNCTEGESICFSGWIGPNNGS